MEELDVDPTFSGLGMDHDQTTHGSLNISDVIEVLQTDPEFGGITSNMYPGGGSIGSGTNNNNNNNISMDDARKRSAYVKLVEQPASKALRFRYECEGRSAGSIPGVNSSPENKTFPSIQIMGYQGRAVVVVSCVTKDPPYRPHPHNLVGKEGCKKGVCTMELNNENMSVTFSNLGIQCVKKKDIEEALRVREEIRVDPYRTGFAHRNQPTSIDLNAVRLCFQVFLEGAVRGKFNFQLNPIVSDPIFDKKAMSDLVICKLSDCSASVAGGKEIILLCEKVAKEDIQVHFYEEHQGRILWEGYGDFQPTQVHKQVAISFRSPRYSSLEVDNPVKINIQLRRPSDGATSEPLPFEFLPLDSGRPAFWSLRKGLAKKGSYAMFSSILASNAAMLTVDGSQTSGLTINPVVEVSFNDDELNKKEVESNTQVTRDVVVLEEDSKEVEIMEQTVQDDITDTNIINNNINVGDVSDYPEVDKWVKSSNAADKNMNVGSNESSEPIDFNDDITSRGETCKSLNELLSQVAELDVVYSDTKARLLGPLDDTNDLEINVDDMYNDNETYSSLQLAMKNPIEVLGMRYEDVMPQIASNKREMSVGADSDSKLPPLPPKRIKKSPPSIPTRPVHLIIANNDPAPIQAPNKNLPPLPEPSTKTQPKPNIFKKLFSKKSSKSKKEATSGSLGGSVGNVSNTGSLRKGSVGNVSTSSMKPFNGSKGSQRSSLVNLAEPNQDGNPEVELTEAENFALYTDMAPHATASEFDEMSFYYSPVEGGKIVTPDSVLKTDVFT